MATEKVPTCVGIIMDGNRRWAKEKGLPTLDGHRRGYEKTRDVLAWTSEAGVKFLVLYAFSTENWKRTEEEVGYLMDLFKRLLTHEVERIEKEGYRIRCIGQRERFSPELQKLMDEAERRTAQNKGTTLVLALSYGGRAEILSGVHRAVCEGKTDITEENFSSLLWSKDVPNPDMIIRPGGEKRLSGFLTWGSVYSELFFTDTKWPDFSFEEFRAMLTEFGERERRRGK